MVPVSLCGLLLLTHIAPSLAVDKSDEWGDIQSEKRYGALVYLLEWPYKAIKQECNYLKHKGYFGIVISSPIDHVNVWTTRSGTEKELKEMINYCWGRHSLRIVLARHMHPDDLYSIYVDLIKNEMRNGQTAIVKYDINKLNEYIVKAHESVGMTMDYDYGELVANYFLKESRDLTRLLTWGGVEVDGYTKLGENERLVFFYNHLSSSTLREKLTKPENKKYYRMAMAFMMAFPYGIPMVLSSYNGEVAPLDDRRWVESPRPTNVRDDQFEYDCRKEYNCEHRDQFTYKMALFKADVKEEKLSQLESNDKEHWFAFERGDRGFIFFNAGQKKVEKTFTGLKMKPGEYCDVASGELVELGSKCSGKIITIKENGESTIIITANDPNGYVAIHRNSKLDPLKKAIGNGIGQNPHAKYMVKFAGKMLGLGVKWVYDSVNRVQETYNVPGATMRDVLVAGIGETGTKLLDVAGNVVVAAATGTGNIAKKKLQEATAPRGPLSDRDQAALSNSDGQSKA